MAQAENLRECDFNELKKTFEEKIKPENPAATLRKLEQEVVHATKEEAVHAQMDRIEKKLNLILVHNKIHRYLIIHCDLKWKI